MFQILTKKCSFNSEIEQGWPIGRSYRSIDYQVSHGRSRLILHWIDKIPKKNIFQSIFQKVLKIIHQLVGHVYSLMPIAVAVQSWWSVCGPVVFAHLQCGLEPSNLDGTKLSSCWCHQRARRFRQKESHFHMHGTLF